MGRESLLDNNCPPKLLWGPSILSHLGQEAKEEQLNNWVSQSLPFKIPVGGDIKRMKQSPQREGPAKNKHPEEQLLQLQG